MKFVSILSLLVLSAIGLAESRRRRRRRANDGKNEGYCANVKVDDKEPVKCDEGLVCCDEGQKDDGVGVCRTQCGSDIEVIEFEKDQGQQQQEQETSKERRRRYRRRY